MDRYLMTFIIQSPEYLKDDTEVPLVLAMEDKSYWKRRDRCQTLENINLLC